ncbi:MAG TPA: C69 family dipeptidase [Solirubrobacterales bacterium]|nr:C69 family dipeptidase [Solirubrobacterales bacterium]
MLAVEGEGASRRAVFGKNSDRPWNEAQPLELVPGGEHPDGSTVRCQALTIPQAERTLTVLGSRPWWLWGFEQGLNEAGVAIGNEAVYTRDTVPGEGLLGMDLVRLGLERGATAAAAKRVITEHIEHYGQGGAAVYLSDTRYFNSFLVADREEAFVIETSGDHWAAKRVAGSVAIANLLTIEDDWDECSPGIEGYARRRGWWTEPEGRRFNFRAAFEDREMRKMTEARYGASCRFLAGEGEQGVPQMMRHLRDHFEGGTVHVPNAAGETRPASICLHPEGWESGTAASMVVDLNAAEAPPRAWCSLATPCTSAFFPVVVGEELPLPLTIAGGSHHERSLWWLFHQLANESEADPATLTPMIQAVLGPWEADLLAAAEEGRLPALTEIVDSLIEKRAEALASLPASVAG